MEVTKYIIRFIIEERGGMKQIRIIPCLDVKNGKVVKGVKFENLKDSRDPVEVAIKGVQGAKDAN